MHEDGRVEDIDASMLPPGFAPEGFEASQPSYVDATQTGAPAMPEVQPEQPLPGTDPSLGVDPLEAPTVAPPPAPTDAPVGALAPGSSRSTSTSSSWRGATMPLSQAMLGADKVSKQAYREASNLYGAYAPSHAAEDAAVTRESELLAQQALAKEQGLFDSARTLRDQSEARAAETAAIQQRAQAWTAEIREAIDSIPTIDSNKMFKDMDAKHSAATAIAAFMGGFLQPVLGTNTPMDIINKAIDRDIAAQKDNADQAQRKVWNLKDLAERDNNDALWELNQDDIKRATYLTALERDVDAQIQGFQSEVYRAQGSKVKAQLGAARIDQFNNIFQRSRTAIETSTHNRRMESIQSQARRDAENARIAAAGAAAAAARRANYLDHTTGIRATGPNAVEGGWIAPNAEIREKANGKFQDGNNAWNAAEDIKELLHGNWGLPGSEERKRAGAAVQRAAFQLMSSIPGLGQKEDMAQMKGVFGGDRDGVYNFASPETALRVVQDYQDSIKGTMRSYAAGLKYHTDDKIDWAPPERAPKAPESAQVFGDSVLELDAATNGTDPEADAESAIRGLLSELEAYPGAINDKNARNNMDRAIEILERMPAEERMQIMNPGGGLEATKALHSGRTRLDRPLFGDAPVDPLLILKQYREKPPTPASDHVSPAAASRRKWPF